MNDRKLEHLFQTIPAIIFCKDRKGKYLAANDICVQLTGNQFEREVIGKSDQSLWGKSSALSNSHDQEVILSGKPKSYIEYGKIHTGKIIAAVSYKTPLCNQSGKNVGILGMSFLLNESNEMMPLLEKKGFVIDRTLINHIVSKECIQLNKLSERQLDCLFYLVKGMTLKQIAKQLHLSPRTVEHHLEAIKNKWGCCDRSELISKAFDLKIIRDRLFL